MMGHLLNLQPVLASYRMGKEAFKFQESSKILIRGHYIYYCGQESVRRNGVAIMINKRV